MTELTAADGHVLGAYENHPADALAGIVVIQEIFGVNAHIRSVVDVWADRGYHTIAPAVFDRIEPGIELGYDPDGIARGRQLKSELAWDDVIADVAAAVRRVAESGPVGIIGFCMGGSVAWLAASSLPVAAAVGYYGAEIPAWVDHTPTVPVMLHFGSQDAAIPLSGVAEVTVAHPEVAVHAYEGAGHGFACDACGSFHAPSAAVADERTAGFFARHLTS
ncbi:MAG: dienelactone hydrolase family protein [Acidimicrobiales bacterium]